MVLVETSNGDGCWKPTDDTSDTDLNSQRVRWRGQLDADIINDDDDDITNI